MDRHERRRHQRHDLKLEVTCKKIGDSEDVFFTGQTLNISTGGLLAHTNGTKITPGDFLNVQLSVPPTDGLLDFGGRFEGYAKVIRVNPNSATVNSSSINHIIAMQFCSSPKLSV